MSSSVRPPGSDLQIVAPTSDLQMVSDTMMSGWSWVNSLISVAAILFGAMIVKWQVRQNARENLRLEIYRDINAANHELLLAEVGATSFARDVTNKLQMLQDPNLYQALLPSFQKLRANDFIDLNYRFSRKRTDLIGVLEKYEIACPELTIFRTALNVAASDITEAHVPLFQAYVAVMSIDVLEADRLAGAPDVLHKAPPSKAVMVQFEVLSDAYIRAASLVGNIEFDLAVETQNLLLGNLFKHRVPRRKPIDPKNIVITLEPGNVARLTTYFENETLWGRQKREAEEAVRQEHGLGAADNTDNGAA